MRLTDAAVANQLQQLAHDGVDLLIIGAGATGCGCALDATARGLRVAMIDYGDIAGGTSSRSTKLVHGGVRYLEQAVLGLDYGQFALVRDALRERSVLLRIAPHLARPLRLMTPTATHWQSVYMWAGLQAYDRLAGRRRLAPSQWWSPQALRNQFPRLQAHAAAVAYSDGQFDDARFAVALAITAYERGAIILPYCPAVNLKRHHHGGFSVAIRDRLAATEVTIHARSVINAAGVFVDAVRQMDNPHAQPLLRPSSGTHIILDHQWWPHRHGLLIPKTDDGRVLFALPWQGQLLVGTTDTPTQPTHHPQPQESEIAYLLEQLHRYLTPAPTRADVRCAWTGLRPLVAPNQNNGATKSLSRDHLVDVSTSGLVTITGGKWTTYRLMAADAVTTAVRVAGFTNPPASTAAIRLAGAERPMAMPADPHQRSLYQRYGCRWPQVLDFHGSSSGPSPLSAVTGYPHFAAEVAYAIEHEFARTVDDVLARRLRIAMLDERTTHQAAAPAQAILSDMLDWTEGQSDTRGTVATLFGSKQLS